MVTGLQLRNRKVEGMSVPLFTHSSLARSLTWESRGLASLLKRGFESGCF